MLIPFFVSLATYVLLVVFLTGIVRFLVPHKAEMRIGSFVVVTWLQFLSWVVGFVLVYGASALDIRWGGEPVVGLLILGAVVALLANALARVPAVRWFLGKLGLSSKLDSKP